MPPGGWIVTRRDGGKLRIKKRVDLLPGEPFQESTRLGADGIGDVLALNERVADEIFADLTHHPLPRAHRGHRLTEDEWNAVEHAFEHGDYLIVLENYHGIAWGAKVSAAFRAKVIAISGRIGTRADYLMSCMAFESAETFSPSVRNAAGSGAVGLIQFMPRTARNLHTSTAALAAMTAVDQLDYVERYFRSLGFPTGSFMTIEDLYMGILCPAAVGKPMSFVCYRQPSLAYTQNRGLDANHDGLITKFEAAAQVRAKLAKGLRFAR